jgi:hypothetical protein
VSQHGRVNARFRLTPAGIEIAQVSVPCNCPCSVSHSRQRFKSAGSTGVSSVLLPQTRTSAFDANSDTAEDGLLSKQQQQQQALLRAQLHLCDEDEYLDHDLGCNDRVGGGALLSWLQPLASRPPPLPPVSVPHLKFPLTSAIGRGDESEAAKAEPVVRAFRTLFSAPPPQCALRLEPFRHARPALSSHNEDIAQPLKWVEKKLRVVRVQLIE